MLEIKVKLNQIVTTDTVVGTVGGYSTSTHYSKSGYDRCAYGAHLHLSLITCHIYNGDCFNYRNYTVNPNDYINFPSSLYTESGIPAVR